MAEKGLEVTKRMLEVDLERGVVPISRAASSLAALIKRSRANHQPIIVTQKGYPTGVLLDVEVFTALRNLASLHITGVSPGVTLDPTTQIPGADTSD